MYDTYKNFREKYPVGCGTTVTDSVKHGLDYCGYTNKMTKLYGIPDEAELVSVRIYFRCLYMYVYCVINICFFLFYYFLFYFYYYYFFFLQNGYFSL